jgi:hypothetical protein
MILALAAMTGDRDDGVRPAALESLTLFGPLDAIAPPRGLGSSGRRTPCNRLTRSPRREHELIHVPSAARDGFVRMAAQALRSRRTGGASRPSSPTTA